MSTYRQSCRWSNRRSRTCRGAAACDKQGSSKIRVQKSTRDANDCAGRTLFINSGSAATALCLTAEERLGLVGRSSAPGTTALWLRLIRQRILYILFRSTASRRRRVFPQYLFRYVLLLMFLGLGLRPLLIKTGLYRVFQNIMTRHDKWSSKKYQEGYYKRNAEEIEKRESHLEAMREKVKSRDNDL